ncbi:MAG: hypothetical protein HN398_08630 [Thiotrichales bacterium]|jgi:chromosome segregation ATPase|nr:hypothetical protein [Thiotrichales bacterium]
MIKIKKIHGLILGSVLGGAFALSGGYMLVPIFEKSEENAKEVVQLSNDKSGLEDKLQNTSNELTTANSTIEEQKKEIVIKVELEGRVAEQQKQLGTLKNEKESLTTQSAELQQNLDSTNSEVSSQKDIIDEQDMLISEKEEQVAELAKSLNELQEIDDRVITNSRYVVGGFMKIADREKFRAMSRLDRHEMIQETMRLSNQLESDTNKRSGMWQQATDKALEFQQ